MSDIVLSLKCDHRLVCGISKCVQHLRGITVALRTRAEQHRTIIPAGHATVVRSKIARFEEFRLKEMMVMSRPPEVEGTHLQRGSAVDPHQHHANTLRLSISVIRLARGAETQTQQLRKEKKPHRTCQNIDIISVTDGKTTNINNNHDYCYYYDYDYYYMFLFGGKLEIGGRIDICPILCYLLRIP